ncbi:MAG TPA: DUF3298 and DUF4163 domain-containing protein [Caulobacteraceae bacterium]|jgi:hypothetical protein
MKGKTPWLIAGVAVVLVLIIAGVYAMLNPARVAPKAPATVAVAPQPATPLAPPAPPVPFSYESKAQGVDVSLKLPQALADTPDLHAKLYNSGVAELRKFAKQSAAEKYDLGVPYEHDVTWTVAAQTDKLLSLKSVTYDFSGGAHGNTVLGAVLWDRSTKAPIKAPALFRPGADRGKLDAILCRAIGDAKKAREGDAYTPNDPTWPCPKWSDSVLVLAPSDQAGKAGGVTFLFSPYAVASFAEGPYEITIPQQAFRDALAAGYIDEFAGNPPKVGDVTPLN